MGSSHSEEEIAAGQAQIDTKSQELADTDEKNAQAKEGGCVRAIGAIGVAADQFNFDWIGVVLREASGGNELVENCASLACWDCC